MIIIGCIADSSIDSNSIQEFSIQEKKKKQTSKT